MSTSRRLVILCYTMLIRGVEGGVCKRLDDNGEARNWDTPY